MPLNLLVVRHGPAGDREKWAKAGLDDSLRPLTRGGRSKTRRAARGLKALLPSLDVLATSPLLRASQTAAALAAAYGVKPVRVPSLSPASDPARLLGWLSRRREGSVAIVGHEPHLSGLVGLLLTGRPARFMELKKGGACLLSFDEAPRPGTGLLRWLLMPSQLRALR